MRLSIDMGGTFTDVVLEGDDRRVSLAKVLTTPDDPVVGIVAGIRLAAEQRGLGVRELLHRTSVIVHGTTRATNAILTGTTARTAFLTTKGHPDILLFRMGGRLDPFDHSREYPDPYVPRSLTFEVDERLDYRGRVVRPLDEGSVHAAAERMAELGVEAAGVCLLWSVVNGAHELAVERILNELLPEVKLTLSHRLNPVVREYHRASSTCIDASLKPLMSAYLENLEQRLAAEGFSGRLLIASVSGGVLEAARLAREPIHSINSGPALAPIAGRHHAVAEGGSETAVVIDAGGTSFDVSVVRRGTIPRTRETWLGERFISHLTGFPSVDVRTTGSGGGSIARVDTGGLLRVGPDSAGSVPGPACYGRGGEQATVTDACMVLGYLDPDRLRDVGVDVDRAAAERVITRQVGEPLGLDPEEAAEAVVRVLTEQMVHAVEEVTVEQGVDPRGGVLVSGGGAAGFNIVAIARRLGCGKLVIPRTCAALSATGGLRSPVFVEQAAALRTTTSDFARDEVNAVLAELASYCWAGIAGVELHATDTRLELQAEARYPGQVWELELPLRVTSFDSDADVSQLRDDFHAVHEDVFAVRDPDSPVEIIGWRARIQVPSPQAVELKPVEGFDVDSASTRLVHLAELGWQEVPVVGSARLGAVEGPAILELPGTSIVLDSGSGAERGTSGAIVVSVAGVRAPNRLGEALDVVG
jgi:N-methylhydantoinase A